LWYILNQALFLGKVKLGIQQDVNVTIFLEDGTEIDDDDTLLACQNGTVFTFVPHGEQWNPSVLSADQTCIDVGSGENLVGQKLSNSSTGIVHHIMYCSRCTLLQYCFK
jgi:hypothetical protein